jgi:hypothetical protein
MPQTSSSPDRFAPRAAEGGSVTPTVPTVTAETKPKQEWEYEVLEDLGSDPKAKLNELGKEGWTLVTANPFIFRRPLEKEEGKAKGRVGFARE